MTYGTVAHQQLTYLTFISVREVDRCSGSYGSSLSCSLHGAHSAAFDVSFIWDIGVVGGGGSGPLSCGFRGKELGGHGWTHPVRMLCRTGAARRPGGARADGMSGPSHKSQRTPEILISGRSVFPLPLWSCCSVHSRHVQPALMLQLPQLHH